MVAFDLRGFGRSQKLEGDYSVQAHSRVIGQVLDALGVSKTSLVASSYGCAPAIQFAIDKKDRVDRLVLINSVGYPGGRHALERLLRIGGVAAMARVALRRTRLGSALFKSRLRQSYATTGALSEQMAETYFELFLRDGGPKSFLQTLKQFDEAKLAAALPAILQPTLIVWGGRDRILPVANARRIHSDIPGAQLRIFPEAGHLPHEEVPDEFNRLISEFLTPAPARARIADKVDGG